MSAQPTPLAIVGVGKIARDQHIPTIAASDAFTLAATVTRHNTLPDVPNYGSIAELVAGQPKVRAIAICTPPRGRIALIRDAVAHGLDILLEKPPAATVTEAEAIVAAIAGSDSVLHVTWHSREAAAVEPARAWLQDRRIARVTVSWREDVRVWHPGQEWIWEPGIGVFDPGINALSILTRILPHPLSLARATLAFPANKAAPIAADLVLDDGTDAAIAVGFDFDQRGPQTWDIAIQTDDGVLTLTAGGSAMAVDGVTQAVPDEPEYARLYARFAELIATRQSDTDLQPFRLVADAYLLGVRREVAAFDWNG
ncbi:galactose 1-dehydrogenase [Sphingomonas guangdongensis]|uniref:Galactose 1-dehydrogenase n=1 Tax=Sphingomonas guangdongensis TaxID=1141890 RepID=A0A285QA81_9SPHN|nr:Gfo/Idh/MocA family oxidoreductase [Sphingomonas guangdongensis]SOB78830.1 galactose 1-dehydrogenase [Sphingomonas guangdongensis]